MKRLICIALLSVAANGTILYVQSNALSVTNSSGQPTVNLTGTLHPDPEWAGPILTSDWISYGSTGDPGDPGYFTPAAGTEVTFTAQFMLTEPILGATLRVLADDTTSIIINGHVLVSSDTNPSATCTKDAVGCRPATKGLFTFAELDPYLLDGLNTLSFGVEEEAGRGFGVDFVARFDEKDMPGDTPEPATVALLGAGLIALAAVRRRK